eukprot:878147-Pelagomonas_calceolata.AAC.1
MASPMDYNTLSVGTINTGALIPATFYLVPTTILSPPASRHVIYSAILNTEATATFMRLPASGRRTITNPYSELLTNTFAISSGLFQKADLPMTNPNPGPARK